MNDEKFFEYVSLLLRDAGHMITSEPIYANHSANETLYIDSKKDVVISSLDRAVLSSIENVSLIMEMKWPGVVDELTERVQIYSITVNFSQRCRSQDVADVHHLLQRFWANNHSIVFFKNADKFILSFADDDRSHILSDWFDLSDDYDEVLERLSIENISLDNSSDYFEDIIYAIARDYYLSPISFENASYGMIPMDLLSPKSDSITSIVSEVTVTKEDIKEIIRSNLSFYANMYGDDYVEAQYEGMLETTNYRNIADEIDRISFELDLAAEMDEEPMEAFDFDDEDDDYIDDDEDFYDDIDDDVDPAIFDDPVLMVKWLEQKQKRADEDAGLDNQRDRREAERIAREEAERKAREEAERKAREEAERIAREEAERKAREEAERIAREEERLESERREVARLEAILCEQNRLVAERCERIRREREQREQERINAEQRELHKLEQIRMESERVVLEEAERKAREEAERKAREEAERKAREEAERIAREEAERKAREEAERKAREEAERKAREEAERIAREEAERKAREEAERIAREGAERKAREESERKAREEAERNILVQKHTTTLHQIKQKYDTELATITANLNAINKRLTEIDNRLSKLSILQFIEKKNLKTEYEELLKKRTTLNSLASRVKRSFELDVQSEKDRHEAAMREHELNYR